MALPAIAPFLKCRGCCHGQVRHWEGVEFLEGIDTLLVRLLVAVRADWALEAFAAGPNEARLELLRAPLLDACRFHVLALLSSNHGDPAAALRIWKACAATLAHKQRLILHSCPIPDRLQCTDVLLCFF